MSILVFAENLQGKFKKSAFEIVSFGSAIAAQKQVPLTVLSVGSVSQEELGKLSQYGASKVITVEGDSFQGNNVQPLVAAISQVAKAENASVVALTASFTGKALAPRVAVRLGAGLAENTVELPDMSSGFICKKNSYSGKAYSYFELLSEVKVISMLPNSYKVESNPQPVNIVPFTAQLSPSDTAVVIRETVRSADKVSLPEAELVVSAGRGMKGPENWGMIEELADVLGAATACSKPVSDAGWRPHSEHVGQTGIAISPNLYIAVGISGAIQHLAGVSSSKVIVVVNKDPEAPFFKAADYGIVGDAFEVVPKLVAAAKSFKAAQN
ncbi:MAG: hypothetical protein RL021_669 [Bacteroidota bacterium]|jgi:electron transfer flavoprotein alpha subunit